jgi:hypothetical protein
MRKEDYQIRFLEEELVSDIEVVLRWRSSSEIRTILMMKNNCYYSMFLFPYFLFQLNMKV